MKKLNKTEAELKKSVAYKKKLVFREQKIVFTSNKKSLVNFSLVKITLEFNGFRPEYSPLDFR